MKIDGAWQEAEVVELQAARAAYEDALHRKVKTPRCSRRTPATASAPACSRSPRDGVKEIIVSYSEEPDRATASPIACTCAGCPNWQTSTSRSSCPRPA